MNRLSSVFRLCAFREPPAAQRFALTPDSVRTFSAHSCKLQITCKYDRRTSELRADEDNDHIDVETIRIELAYAARQT